MMWKHKLKLVDELHQRRGGFVTTQTNALERFTCSISNFLSSSGSRGFGLRSSPQCSCWWMSSPTSPWTSSPRGIQWALWRR